MRRRGGGGLAVSPTCTARPPVARRRTVTLYPDSGVLVKTDWNKKQEAVPLKQGTAAGG